MDLFSEPVEPAQADEWEAIAWDDSIEPIPDDVTAAAFGSERAGIPSWSNPSLERLNSRWRRFLQSKDAETQALLIEYEREGYKAARRRKVALLAMAREFPGGGS
jgi:hypothetical protein